MRWFQNRILKLLGLMDDGWGGGGVVFGLDAGVCGWTDYLPPECRYLFLCFVDFCSCGVGDVVIYGTCNVLLSGGVEPTLS